MNDDALYCIKMRASRAGEHVSGAERIVPADALSDLARKLAARALGHPKATPDFINIKIFRAGEISRIDALDVRTHEVGNPAEGLAVAVALLREAGVPKADKAVDMLLDAPPMRGAMLVDADTLERLDEDRERGVRATNMDFLGVAADSGDMSGKNHFSEALVLASKVAAAPGMVAEICISDDPDYVTGYVASRSLGYRRITRMKEKGIACGGRIFFWRGERDSLRRTVEWLEEACVLVGRAHGGGNAAAPRRDPMASLAAELEETEAKGLYRRCETTPDGATVLASNDYLGLARDKRVAAAAAAAARLYGGGTGGSRLATGTIPLHGELERRLAAFKHAEAVTLFSTGYMANIGVICSLAGKQDAVFSDELNHASIIDACRLSGAKIHIYPHGNLNVLGNMLETASKGAFRRLVIVSDGVFSMDGDLLDLPHYLAVCRKYGAISIVDEAHSTGVVGATGRGLTEHFRCDAPDVTVGTLSKALGSMGGFVAGSHLLAEYLRNKARSFIFSTSLCPAAAAAALKALDIIESDFSIVDKLRKNVDIFTKTLGWTKKSESAIVPVIVGDERKASAISAAMAAEGFIVPAIRYPTVPLGAARLRFAVSAAHSPDVLVSAAETARRISGGFSPLSQP